MKSKQLRAASMVLIWVASLLPFTSIAVGQTGPIINPQGSMGITGADPSVIQTSDGYISVEARAGRSIFVRMAASLAELASASPSRIFTDTQRLGEVWAPEIVVRDMRYEVYFTAGVGSAHRMFVISSDNPTNGFGGAVELQLPDDKWAIDGLPFAYQGTDYFIWSGWQGDTDIEQDIFIAEVANGTVQAPRVMISTPDKPWENINGDKPSINEGPQPIVDPSGNLHIVYSANGSWSPDYCLVDLRLKEDAVPLDPHDWVESDGCLFGANPLALAETGTLATEAKGVGHHSFALPNSHIEQAADAAETGQFIYHGVPADENPRNFWAARKWFSGTFQWVPNVQYGAGDASDLGWSLVFTE